MPTAYAEGVKRPVERIAGVAPVGFRSSRAYPWEHSGAVDIERLLHWAFAVQRVDGNPVAGLHRLEAEAGGYHWYGHSTDGIFEIERRSQIGATIDISADCGTPEFHPAAEAALVAVMGCACPTMMREHAFLGTRPDGWKVPVRWYLPTDWKPGRVDVEAAEEYRGPRKNNPYCAVFAQTSPASIEAARARYWLWHDELTNIRWHLAARNLGFVVLGPDAPRTPWEDAAND